MRRLPIVCLLLALAVDPGLSKPKTDWSALQRPSQIPITAEIQVQTTDGRLYRGKFKAADEATLAISGASGDERWPRASVAEVSVQKHSARWKHVLEGLGIDAAVGLAMGAAVDSHCSSYCFGLGKAFGAGIGFIGGGVVGATLPSSGWRVIYRKR